MLMNQKVGAASRDLDQGRVRGATQNVAVVSGGSRGLGAELVSGFLDRGYAVANSEPDENRLHRTIAAPAACEEFLLVRRRCTR